MFQNKFQWNVLKFGSVGFTEDLVQSNLPKRV